jgi:hypothetical protein
MSAMPAQSVDAVDVEERNLDLAADLLKSIGDDPAILAQIPEGAMLVLLPTDADEAFLEANVAIGLDMLRIGHDVYFRHVDSR